MDNIPEQAVNSEQRGGNKLKVVEARTNVKDSDRMCGLLEYGMRVEKIEEKWDTFDKLVGEYKKKDFTGEIKVNLVNGKAGNGQVKDGILELSLPTDEELNSQQEWKTFFESKGLNYENVLIFSTTSTALHEGGHIMLDSRPGSKLAEDCKNIGLENDPNGHTLSLLDEGIVYAYQFLQDEKTRC